MQENFWIELKKETNDAAFLSIRSLLDQKKKIKELKKDIRDKIRDIRNLFEHEEEHYYKPVRVGNFRSNNYIDYKSKGNKKNTIS